MDDLDRLILKTYRKVLRKISPDELRARLARRNLPICTRPPRAWCLSIRASDRRINNDTAIITPYRALYPANQPYPHDVTIDHKLLEHLCKPFELLPNTDWTDVAKGLGVHPESLRHTMKSGRFRLHHYKHLGGKRGKPVPVFLNFESLDPNSGRLRNPPDPLFGQMWRYASQSIPKTFQQTIRRVPAFLAYKGQPRFRGFKWQCPKCEKQSRILYYPLPPYDLPRFLGYDPSYKLKDEVGTMKDESETNSSFILQNSEFSPAPSAYRLLPTAYSSSFACHHCHQVKFFSRIDRDSWNHYITHATAGLLFGHEVKKPKNFHAQENRKRKYRPNFNTPPSPRRQQVKTLLLQGLSYDQIAKELKVGYPTVHMHVKILYKQNGIKSRQELAKKERVTLPEKPLSARQQAIQKLLLTDQNYAQIAASLNTTYHIVHHTAKFLYRHYNVHNRKELGEQVDKGLLSPTD
jgi:DNA-binding NarL/FixJ family response regulator